MVYADRMKCDHKEISMHDIYVRYRSELCQYVVGNVGMTRSEAEDVVQSAFARIAEIDLDSIKNPRAFLYKASYNIAIDLKRRGHVRQKHVDALLDRGSEAVEELSPERFYEGSRQMSIIAKALWGMPKKRRQLLMMSRFDGLSYAEIARRVSLSETVVRKHISKALADCQRALQA